MTLYNIFLDSWLGQTLTMCFYNTSNFDASILLIGASPLPIYSVPIDSSGGQEVIDLTHIVQVHEIVLFTPEAPRNICANEKILHRERKLSYCKGDHVHTLLEIQVTHSN